MSTYKTFGELRWAVEKALLGAGEPRCRERTVKSTGCARYVSGEPGFRIYVGYFPSFLDKEAKSDNGFLCVRHDPNTKGVLRRYEKALREAGIPVRITNEIVYKTRYSVWVEIPFDRAWNAVETSSNAKQEGEVR